MPKKLRDTSERFFLAMVLLICLVIVCWFANVTFCGHSMAFPIQIPPEVWCFRFVYKVQIPNLNFGVWMSFFGIGSGVAPSIWFRTSCRFARSLWSTSHFQIVCHRNCRTSAYGQPRSWWPSMYTCLFQLDDSNSLHGKWLSSWWFQPIWKIWSSNWIISPSRDENKKCLKPPPSILTKHPLNKLLFGVPGGNSSIFQGSWKCWITILDVWFSWNGDLLLGLFFWSCKKNGHVPKNFGVKTENI